MNLNKTTASTNFAKVGLFQGTTPISMANTPISTSYNDTSIRFLPQNDINIAPGQSVDLSVLVDYLRNTNVEGEQGATPVADYFMFGIDTIKIDTNGIADGGYTNASILSRFDKPIKVQ